MSNPARIIGLAGEIEAPRPLRASGGEVLLRGWCLAESGHPPAVRLVTAAGNLVAAGNLARPDIGRQFPDNPAAGRCGFTISGRLPTGVYPARFEALGPDGNWEAFRQYSLVVETPRLTVEIESPSVSVARDRVFISGWALHPNQAVTELSVRYGHQEIPCAHGRIRQDVPMRFPGISHARLAGFQSETILAAGSGPLRVKARLADGSVAIARTVLSVDIGSDENHPPGFDFRAHRIPLPGYARRESEPVPPATRARNILFVLYGNLTSNSALQVGALANALAAAGHSCALAVPRDPATIRHHLAPRFRTLLHAEAVATGGAFPNGRGPDIIHGWTTRELVRQTCTALQDRHGGTLVVGLEDNEQLILARELGRDFAELDALPDEKLDPLVGPERSHPHRAREFLARAAGVTVIVDRLREFVPAAKPCVIVPPAADARYFFPRQLPAEFREALAFPPGTTVLFYHGNVHAANAAEMHELHIAVARLNEGGLPTVLIRAGRDSVDCLGAEAARVRPYVISLGQILDHRYLPALMALADIFVQPGVPDPFNDYRFPSKLPEFFAIGRPVVLPRTNLGTQVRHGTDAYVLERADAAGIATAVRALRSDPDLAGRLSRGAVEFAAKHFSWRRSAEVLASFYDSLAAS